MKVNLTSVNALLRAYDEGKAEGRAEAVEEFQDWLKTQAVGIDRNTNDILVVNDRNKWEYVIDKFKEAQHG